MSTKVTPLFNGTHTLRNKATGDYRTFDVRTQPDDSKFAPGKRIVSLLDGPSNEDDFTGFGFVTDDGISVWSKRCGGTERKDWSNWQWFGLMLWMAANDKLDGYELLTEGRCLRCNRKLTTPDSIERGIGPFCAAKLGAP